MAGPCRLLVSPISVPPLMFQFWAPVPVKAQTEAPILLKTENPRYCCAGPIVLTLKVPSSVLAITGSPSWKVSVDGETGSERERKRTAREVDRGTAAIDRALVEDAAGSGHVDGAVDHPEVGDRALRVAGDGQGLIDDASARVRDRIDPVARDCDSVVERAGVGDRVLAAGHAERLVDGRAGSVRGGMCAT